LARSDKPVKTKTPNIFVVKNSDDSIKYIFATFTIRGRRYSEINLTTKYSIKTISQAKAKLDSLKTDIRNGVDPFKNNNTSKISFRDMVILELKNRNVAESTKNNQINSFKKHCYQLFKNLKIEDINIDVIETIFLKLSKTVKNDVLSTIKKAISPTLKKAVDKRLILVNPLETHTIVKIKGKVTSKAPLSYRLNAPINNNVYIETVQSFYKSIHNFKYNEKAPINELRLAFFWALMTARRRSEILKVEYSDIIGDVVKTRPDTTKTNVYEFYPIPDEVVSLLDPNGEGLIFPNLKLNRYSAYMKQVIHNAGIDTNVITGHDTRNLFLTIMSKQTKNPFLCDMCLSHNKKEYKILMKYYTPDLNDFKEIFNAYWKILRSKK